MNQSSKDRTGLDPSKEHLGVGTSNEMEMKRKGRGVRNRKYHVVVVAL